MDGSATQERPPHRRAKSSVLKSIMVTRNHKQYPSEGGINLSTTTDTFEVGQANPRNHTPPSSNLEPIHGPLGEIHQNASRPTISPEKEKGLKSTRTPQKTKSSISVRTLFDAAARGPESERKPAGRSPKKENASPAKPKKSKSSTSLSSIFSRANRSSKNLHDAPRGEEKENTTPPASAESEARTPIWAQFARRGVEDLATTSSSPTKYRDEGLALGTPRVHGKESAKDQNKGLGDVDPALRQSRPKSGPIPQDMVSADPVTASRGSDECSNGRRTRSQSRVGPENRNSRVMAAVAALTGNDPVAKASVDHVDPQLQGKELDAAFEAVLNERNVPENMRAGMRGLTARVKMDFIMNSRHTPPATATDEKTKLEEDVNRKRSRSKAPRSAGSDGSKSDGGALEAQEKPITGSSKHTRSRSKTFSFNKDSISPSKKTKASREADAPQLESVSMHKSTSSKSLSSTGNQHNRVTSTGRKGPQPPEPEEYVDYLRKVQKPEAVEVGKAHKLRLLLRNETVGWVDGFIQQGGMKEVTELLYRIMKVEWREEHEDQLLHEVLLCVKGLCTTELALRKLCEIEGTLFPALLRMLFDEEKKGPSEFATRAIVTNLLCGFFSLATANKPSQIITDSWTSNDMLTLF